MTDDELLWEPVDGCWSVRNRDGKWTFEVVKPLREIAAHLRQGDLLPGGEFHDDIAA